MRSLKSNKLVISERSDSLNQNLIEERYDKYGIEILYLRSYLKILDLGCSISGNFTVIFHILEIRP